MAETLSHNAMLEIMGSKYERLYWKQEQHTSRLKLSTEVCKRQDCGNPDPKPA